MASKASQASKVKVQARMRSKDLDRIRGVLDAINMSDDTWRASCSTRVVAQNGNTVIWAACSPMLEGQETGSEPEEIAAHDQLITNAPQWLRWLLRQVEELEVRDRQVDELYTLNNELIQQLKELREEQDRQRHGEILDLQRRTLHIDI